jgi:hypothetical protein
MKSNRIFNIIGIAVTSLLLLSGCIETKPAGVSNEEVAAITENALQAINENDYQKFTHDFSTQMSNAFSEGQFNQLRDMLQNASGNYISLGTPSLSDAQGYAIYQFPAKFEKEDVIVTITFIIGGDKIEGLFFKSPNITKGNQ